VVDSEFGQCFGRIAPIDSHGVPIMASKEIAVREFRQRATELIREGR
jgi:hypothetical protein